MEWVETTGKTVEEAKDAALDQLGVDEQDAEFEVLEEAKSGLFGRLRTEARVRARIRPTRPRPKAERRDRKRRSPAAESASPEPVSDTPEEVSVPAVSSARRRGSSAAGAVAAVLAEEAPTASDELDDLPASTPAAPAPRVARKRPAPPVDERSEGAPVEQRTIEVQQSALKGFFEGLLDAFDLDGDVDVEVIDEDNLEAKLSGDDLGLLIGPKGATLSALQDLARSAVQRPGDARFRVDVGGYRERRREALERFTRSVAEQVLASGEAVSMEPMNASDRKVVHDTANTIDGVRTSSEGEDPRRRVVLSPDD
jgi:spoIIIJ-associated protein